MNREGRINIQPNILLSTKLIVAGVYLFIISLLLGLYLYYLAEQRRFNN